MRLPDVLAQRESDNSGFELSNIRRIAGSAVALRNEASRTVLTFALGENCGIS